MLDNDGLNDKQVKETKFYSILEGSAANVMVGFGEQYVVPFAIYLGATAAQVGFLASVPFFIGSLFQMLGADLTERLGKRKQLVLVCALLQAIILAPLFFIPFLSKSIPLLIVLFTAYLAFGNLLSPLWNSWIGDVIPHEQRPKYFSRRNKVVTFFLFFSVLVSGIILESFDLPHKWIGFCILFIIALIGRLFSFGFFLSHHEPPFRADIWHDYSFKEFLENLTSDNFGSFTIFRSSIAFSVMVAAPFFTIYMLRDLSFSYIQFTMTVLFPMIVKAVTMRYWGAFSERFGNRNIMHLSSVLIAFIPLIWAAFGFFFMDTALIFPMILLVEGFSGFAWAGFELTTFNYMLGASSIRHRTRQFAYFSAIFGGAVLVGSLLGIVLLDVLKTVNLPLDVFLLVFIISGFLRMICALLFIPQVKDIENHEKVSEKRLFYEVLFYRPLGVVAPSAISRLSFLTPSEHEVDMRAKKAKKRPA